MPLVFSAAKVAASASRMQKRRPPPVAVAHVQTALLACSLTFYRARQTRMGPSTWAPPMSGSLVALSRVALLRPKTPRGPSFAIMFCCVDVFDPIPPLSVR